MRILYRIISENYSVMVDLEFYKMDRKLNCMAKELEYVKCMSHLIFRLCVILYSRCTVEQQPIANIYMYRVELYVILLFINKIKYS